MFEPTKEQAAELGARAYNGKHLHTHTDLAAAYGVSETAIRRARRRLEFPEHYAAAEKPEIHAGPLGTSGSTTHEDGSMTVTSPPIRGGLADVVDAESYLRERWSLPADRWGVKPVLVNEWEANAGEGVIMTLGQVKGSFYPLDALADILPAPASWAGPTFERHENAVTEGEYHILVVGDSQAPYHDEALHAATCEAILDIAPRRIVHIGDLCDYTNISKHPDHAVIKASVDECTQAGVNILLGMRDAAPYAQFDVLAGNHDIRPLAELLLRAERMAGIHCGALPEDTSAPRRRLLDLRALWRLDDLGIGYVEDERGWKHGELDLIPGPRGLVAVHGSLTGKNVALNTLASVGRSVVCGHTHRPEMIYQWNPTIGFEMRAMVIGAQCAVRGGKGFPTFVERDKWLQGGALVTVHADGEWDIERARWNGESLFVCGERWTP